MMQKQQWSLLFFMSFTKNQWTLFTHRTYKCSQKISLRILVSIIHFPDMFSFLLAGVTSIFWTLQEDAESFWGFNICSLSLFGRIVELTLLFTRLSFIEFAIYIWKFNSSIYNIYNIFSYSQETFSILMSLGSLFISANFTHSSVSELINLASTFHVKFVVFFSSLPCLSKHNFPVFYGNVSTGPFATINQK